MNSFTLNSAIQQSAQANGYWLIQFSLKEPLPFAQSLGQGFFLSSASQTELYLFQHAEHNPSQHYQFLSNQPLPEEILTRPGELISTNLTSITLADENQALLILGEDLAMANVFALAKQRTLVRTQAPTIAMLASQTSYPFILKPARYLMPEMPPEAMGACTLLEDWQVQNRLASQLGLPGCFEGDISDLFLYWVEAMQQDVADGEATNWQVMLFTDKAMQKKCLQIGHNQNWLTMQAF